MIRNDFQREYRLRKCSIQLQILLKMLQRIQVYCSNKNLTCRSRNIETGSCNLYIIILKLFLKSFFCLKFLYYTILYKEKLIAR